MENLQKCNKYVYSGNHPDVTIDDIYLDYKKEEFNASTKMKIITLLYAKINKVETILYSNTTFDGCGPCHYILSKNNLIFTNKLLNGSEGLSTLNKNADVFFDNLYLKYKIGVFLEN